MVKEIRLQKFKEIGCSFLYACFVCVCLFVLVVVVCGLIDRQKVIALSYWELKQLYFQILNIVGGEYIEFTSYFWRQN